MRLILKYVLLSKWITENKNLTINYQKSSILLHNISMKRLGTKTYYFWWLNLYVVITKTKES